ncbi:ATP-binding cassette sub-family C member 4-like [Oculina patagonica]
MERNGYKRISTEGDKENVSFVSRLFFRWMNSVFKTGSERALEEDDLLPLTEENVTCTLTEQLQTKWNNESTKCKSNGKRPKLWKSVLKMLSEKEGIFIIFTGVLYSICGLLQPLLLGYLISTLTSAEPQGNHLLRYGCALAMGITALIGCLSAQHFDYRCELLGIRISSALKGLVYLKTLVLSKHSLSTFSTGHVIDLISNDVQRLEEDTVDFFCLGAAALFKLVAVMALLLVFVGWQAIMGVVFLCLLVPYFTGLSYVGAVLRLLTAAVSDRRISLMNEVVSGIRAIKTHAWEDEYRKKIKNTRSAEIGIIRKKSAVLSGVAGLDYTAGSMATLVSVIFLVLTGQSLTPVNVFMLLSFINLARFSTCHHLGQGLLQTYEAYASLGRIENFLLLENLHNQSTEDTSKMESSLAKLKSSPTERRKKNEVSHADEPVKDLDKPTALCVSGLTHQQINREDDFILQDIEFTTPSGTLTIITGPVGSGKSTLLSAIAGEIYDTSGTITCQGTLVYVPQISWVFSGTIRENILFGLPYDELKYTGIIEACALTEDIQKFPDNDQTIVGERGAVLSGGQRARISLARAVYADADIYLLDDPLCAVDFKVSQHIFDKCIRDLLCNKTRVLTSHQEQHMKQADEVVVLYKGRVLGKGSFSELQEQGFLNTTVDRLYKKVLTDNKADQSFAEEIKEEGEDADSCGKMATSAKECKGLDISQEDRSIGVVSSKLYWDYFRSGMHPLGIFAVICLCLVTQAMTVAPDVWLPFLTKQLPEDQKDNTNLTIYGCLVGASFTFAFIRACVFLLVSLRCSERLHNKMVVAVLQAPVLFFDSNPVGRIMNRFSKDVGCMDEMLPKKFLMAIQMVLLLLSTVLVPTATNPWLLFVVVPMTVVVVYISKYYLKTARELKRLESICRSPVFSHISETLNGLDTIRTRGRQRDFVDQFYRHQDIHNQSYVMVMASGRWLGVRLDLLASLLIGVVALAAVVVSQDAAFAGLALVYVIQTVTLTQYTVRKTSDVENYMTSVERVMTYTKLDYEPGYKVERHPQEHWPREGNITFQDVSLVYYPGGPQVLKKINLSIKGGAKIGVAGRTGAGKSSFVAALMRMPDADGEIMVDDIQIKEINLQEARKCISVLGQSPVLFSGSLRKNLDVMVQFQDADLWRALEDVQLKALVESLEGQLDHELLEHGANVSVGERQLICLARVLLQQNKIIILDEPTAHVDPDTEQTIWRIVREKLKDSTVITIAHRLNTIRDCDLILVLKNGEVDEFDRFDALVNNEGSALSEMARVANM